MSLLLPKSHVAKENRGEQDEIGRKIMDRKSDRNSDGIMYWEAEHAADELIRAYKVNQNPPLLKAAKKEMADRITVMKKILKENRGE